jgi:hypothetical protein
MKISVKYINADDRATIITQNTDKFLIEEQNLIDDNYLIFDDTQPIITVSPPTESERLSALEDIMSILI